MRTPGEASTGDVVDYVNEGVDDGRAAIESDCLVQQNSAPVVVLLDQEDETQNK